MATRKKASAKQRVEQRTLSGEVWGLHERDGFTFAVAPFGTRELLISVQHRSTGWAARGTRPRTGRDHEVVGSFLARDRRNFDRVNGIRADALAAWRAVCTEAGWSESTSPDAA